jgi:hypothetical protein
MEPGDAPPGRWSAASAYRPYAQNSVGRTSVTRFFAANHARSCWVMSLSPSVGALPPSGRPGQLYGLYGHRMDWLRGMIQVANAATRADSALGA